ncbi:MAG: hypothetical protein JWN14_1203 [Chthonomonadales bacterium]|nr:hypothetical protein [Chthonomonadales bacterium]
MRIRYESKLEDYVAFNDYHYSHSPTMKGYLFWYRYLGACAILFLPYLMLRALGSTASLLLIFPVSLIGTAFFVAIAPRILKRRLKHNARKFLSEGKNDSFVGEKELEITEAGLIARSEYTETKLAWGAFERIASTPTHTFLYLSSVQAYVIPHNNILEGDFRAFLTEVGHRFQPGQRLNQKAH